MKKNILVFPCGSEVALEIYRSLKFSTHFNLIGASSVDDHGKFVFKEYISGLPFHDNPCFINTLRNIVNKRSIDAIYPAMDVVAETLKKHEEELGCTIIGSDHKTTMICASKKLTYQHLYDVVKCPQWWERIAQISQYPIFIKPDRGYGSRNVCLAKNRAEAEIFVQQRGGESFFIFSENLSGEEFTIDCFSDYKGVLLFYGARKRVRIRNGISVNTVASTKHRDTFSRIAEEINKKLKPRGAWFFQMKENSEGDPVLLEVATRLGGSSSYFRGIGVNFAMLSVFDSFNIPVTLQTNGYKVELDRALTSRYKLDLDYSCVYVDFDDCIIINNEINHELISFLYQAFNHGKKLILITRHANNLSNSLEKYRLAQLFDEVIHLKHNQQKYEFIKNKNSIFIDDSFAERQNVAIHCGIAVFSPDMVEALII